MLAALALAAAIVRTDAGRIAGETLGDGRSLFRGIPFAQPPVGDLRWKPPAPVHVWGGVRDATRSAPGCMQIDYGWNHRDTDPQSEDCLYLEVATPALQPAKPLPVIVWIHGGGNRGGGAAGTIQSDIGKRVVLVSIAYRLSALGFLSHPSLTAESPHRSSGNYGLLDQQAALRWVQANIARFGGDPRNVTIAGQSAGAQDVGLQQLSPLARGLFAKAIEESGTPGFGVPSRSLAENEALGEQIALAAGAPPHADAATLRRLPAEELIEAAEHAHLPALGDDSFIWLQAVVDGWVLREPPAQALARGDAARVPLLIGTNAQEFTGFGGQIRLRETIARAYGDNAAVAQAFYHAASDPRRGDTAMQLSTDFIFACPTDVSAAARARMGRPVWQYEYDVADPDGKPVHHSSELHAVFDSAAQPSLQAYWINFARTGDPNGEGLPRWPTYAPGKSYIVLEQGGAEVRADLRRSVCRLRNAP